MQKRCVRSIACSSAVAAARTALAPYECIVAIPEALRPLWGRPYGGGSQDRVNGGRGVAVVVKSSLPDVTDGRLAPEHSIARSGQPAHQPFRVDRIPRPWLRPAVGDARLDRFFGNLAAVAVEEGEFSTGLIESAHKISFLRHARPHGCLIGVFRLIGRGVGNLAQVGVTARGFLVTRTRAHGRHLLTMIKTSLPRWFIWARIAEWHGGMRAAKRARCHAIYHHTPVARPAHLSGRGSPSWFSVRRGDERHGE